MGKRKSQTLSYVRKQIEFCKFTFQRPYDTIIKIKCEGEKYGEIFNCT